MVNLLILKKGFETKKPTICCYLTHDRARFIDEKNEKEALEFGLEDLSKLLNLDVETMKNHLVQSRRCSWESGKFTKRAYSTVKIGKKNARKDLLEPIGSLLFCGEACAIYSNPQTVHGAIDSGIFLEKYFKEFSKKNDRFI
jgi:monoamine oxidase